MWIVRTALEKPYTFIVMAILILITTPLAVMRTPVDVLPEINIPVISVIWNYNGLSAQQMGNRITQTHERTLTTTVNDIEHIESQSLGGIAIIKIFFQPNVNIQTAIAQVVSVSGGAATDASWHYATADYQVHGFVSTSHSIRDVEYRSCRKRIIRCGD